jgi:hypothetical protein
VNLLRISLASRPVLGVLLAAFSAATISAAPAVDDANPLQGLKPGHPRLLASDADWKTIKEKQKKDPELARVMAQVDADAEGLLNQPPLVYEKKGKRLLDVSRQAVQRVLLWSVQYKLSGEPRYVERTKKELLNLAAFKDWNPSHFLDTAEMTAALAIGYDWLFDQLDPATRRVIRQAIVEKGLQPGLQIIDSGKGWPRTQNNWNQVCFGGLTLGSLAIGDEAPEPAKRLLVAARTGIAHGLRPYAPEGIYPEGPGYWAYGSVYQVLMLAALESALGTTWNIEASPGFLPSAAAQVELTGPTGQPYNFFDSGEGSELQPPMFWFARRLKNPGLLRFQRQPLSRALGQSAAEEPPYHENRFFGLLPLWWTGLPDPKLPPELPLIWHADGPNPVGIFRTSWTDPNALFLAFKGGAANLSHAHMDAGSFILEADGVRWGIDLGRQDYLSLESKGVELWNSTQDGQRWRVFRLNNFSHNTLTLGDQLHRVTGSARMVEFKASPPQAKLDLSAVFAGQATGVFRTFRSGKDRTVTVRDEITGAAPGTSVRWAMVTRAKVEIDGDHALLRQQGKTLEARLLAAPANSHFAVVPANPPADGFNAPNPDTWILMVEAKTPASGQTQLEVGLQPIGR